MEHLIAQLLAMPAIQILLGAAAIFLLGSLIRSRGTGLNPDPIYFAMLMAGELESEERKNSARDASSESAAPLSAASEKQAEEDPLPELRQ